MVESKLMRFYALPQEPNQFIREFSVLNDFLKGIVYVTQMFAIVHVRFPILHILSVNPPILSPAGASDDFLKVYGKRT